MGIQWRKKKPWCHILQIKRFANGGFGSCRTTNIRLLETRQIRLRTLYGDVFLATRRRRSRRCSNSQLHDQHNRIYSPITSCAPKIPTAVQEFQTGMLYSTINFQPDRCIRPGRPPIPPPATQPAPRADSRFRELLDNATPAKNGPGI